MFANKLGDLDDFLAPSLECIKPAVVSSNSNAAAVINPSDDVIASFSLTTSTAPAIQKQRPDLIKAGADKIAQVSLQDCLACSGCVTSAETVLIQ